MFEDKLDHRALIDLPRTPNWLYGSCLAPEERMEKDGKEKEKRRTKRKNGKGIDREEGMGKASIIFWTVIHR